MYASFDFEAMTTAAGHWLQDLSPEIIFIVGLFVAAWIIDMAVDFVRGRSRKRSSLEKAQDWRYAPHRTNRYGVMRDGTYPDEHSVWYDD